MWRSRDQARLRVEGSAKDEAAVRVYSAVEAAEEEYDVFKHSLLRYFGYSNELGESFRPLVHARWVTFSYLVAGTYVAADTADKYLKAHQMENYTAEQRRMLGTSNAIDTAIWQGLASVAIPGLVINRIVWATAKLPLKGALARAVPTAIGLSSIPFIITPIDNAVHKFADMTYKPILKRFFPVPHRYPSDTS